MYIVGYIDDENDMIDDYIKIVEKLKGDRFGIVVFGGAPSTLLPLTDDYNYAIIDPPRSGVDINTLNTLNKINLKNIIYISCDYNTLVRDINILKDKYYIKECRLFDMFPNTYHVETVMVLERKN